jgi:bifunctional DNA-binding transcriptional regulator/antitoxin component of YhaV-PrlF toxin-antitoxin module
MTVSTILQIRGKGTLTLPVDLRRKYGLDEGAIITLIDLGEGSFLLTPVVTQLDRLGDRVAQALEAEGVSIDDLLAALDEERERYYQEQYVSP